MSEPPLPSTLGCILAGGLSRRMGGSDKALISLGGKPLLAHVIDRLRPQVPTLIINANGEASRFASFGIHVLPDTVEGFQGPLAGVLSALRHAARIGLDDVLTMATDTPFAPLNLARRLHDSRSSRDGIALASSGGRVHPVVGLWPVALADDLEDWLRGGDERSVRAWAERHPLTVVEFPCAGFDPFFNVNMPGDLAEAQRHLAEMRRP